ncbi:MAG TPA: hypothetical protein VMY35_00625, partial [Phycisphaerae bacterium]|nr:hypothetical protein [Phycisphaerae bacterium]
ATAAGFSMHSAADVLSAVQAAGTHLTLIKAVTDAIPDAGALTTIAADAARLTAERAAVLTDLIDGGRLDLLIDALPTAAAIATAVMASNVDSTGGTAVALSKAAEVILAILGGVCSYNAVTGVWTVKGRNGTSTVFAGTDTAEGTRTASTIT